MFNPKTGTVQPRDAFANAAFKRWFEIVES
jgi:hypothetical protein